MTSRSLWARYRANPMWGDAVGLLLLFPFVFLTTVEVLQGLAPMPFRLGLATLFTAPLLWRRTAPDAAAAVTVLAHLVQLFTLQSVIPANVVAPIMLYTVARYGQARFSRIWLLVGLAASALGGISWGGARGTVQDSTGTVVAQISLVDQLVGMLLWAISCAGVSLSAWFLGQWLRSRQATLDSLRQRAEALEREREQGMRLVAEEERNRIAREMHDIVAHSLSVIVVQSDGAGYLAGHAEAGDAEARLAQVERAIETINQTARTALGETRRLVGVLRQDDEGPALAPAATLEQIADLVGQLRGAGIPAGFTSQGSPESHPPLSAGAQMAAYRVVQESLTNVMKHAGPSATVEVELRHSPDGLDIRVADTGRGAQAAAPAEPEDQAPGDRAPDGQGHGVIGMRERMAAWGGTLVARPRTQGGFEVLAQLPATTSGDPA